MDRHIAIAFGLIAFMTSLAYGSAYLTEWIVRRRALRNVQPTDEDVRESDPSEG